MPPKPSLAALVMFGTVVACGAPDDTDPETASAAPTASEAPSATPTAWPESPTLTPTSPPAASPTGLPETPTGTWHPTDPPTPTSPDQRTPTTTPTATPQPTQPPTLRPGILEACSDRTRTFFAWDLAVMPPKTVEVPATCRLMGPASYLYVADDQWGVTVDAELAYRFMEVMEARVGGAAYHPELGIIDNDRAVFGEFPDALDEDPRIYLLLMDLADFTSSEGVTYSFDGYFNAYDELTDEQVSRVTRGLYRSNEVEMLYLNSRLRPADDPYTLAVAAHEMQHLIAYNYDTSEEIWLSEALAEVAMLVNGLYTDEPWVVSYASHPERPLVNNTSSGSYGAYLLWGMYLFEQLGEEFILALEAQQSDGIEGIDRTLRLGGWETDFDTLFSDWIVANAINDRREGLTRFSYAFEDDLPPMKRVATLESPGDAYEGEVLSYAADYLDIFPSQEATLTVTGAPPTATVRLVNFESFGSIQVLDLPPGPSGRTADLHPENDYLLIVSQQDPREVDTGVTVLYQATLD